MTYPILPRLFLPWFRLELPGWGRLYRWLNVHEQEGNVRWKNAPTRIVRGKWHSYAMHLNLSNWSERMTYFLGRFYDLELQLLMMACLRPGDRMLDIGGNIGMISLLASRLVGPKGIVDCFEPNPTCCARIEESVRLNGIKNVRLHPVGLSDQAGELTLSVITTHSGMGTLAEVPDGQRAMISATYLIPVEQGDDIVRRNSRPVRLVKIDVEGFEMHVLLGLKKTLTAQRPLVAMEMIEPHLQRAGTSAKEIVSFMGCLGYRPFGLSTRRRLLGHRLQLVPLNDASDNLGRSLPNWLWVSGDDPLSILAYS